MFYIKDKKTSTVFSRGYARQGELIFDGNFGNKVESDNQQMMMFSFNYELRHLFWTIFNDVLDPDYPNYKSYRCHEISCWLKIDRSIIFDRLKHVMTGDIVIMNDDVEVKSITPKDMLKAVRAGIGMRATGSVKYPTVSNDQMINDWKSRKIKDQIYFYPIPREWSKKIRGKGIHKKIYGDLHVWADNADSATILKMTHGLEVIDHKLLLKKLNEYLTVDYWENF